MKQFDLELAKKGYPVCTRSGKNVRIICWDAHDVHYPIIGLIEDDGVEHVETFTIDGKCSIHEAHHLSDLMLATTICTGWVHVYSRDRGRKPVAGRAIFSTKQEALEAAKQHKTEDRIIDTICIEWEE